MKKRFFMMAIATLTVCVMSACGSKDGGKEYTEPVVDTADDSDEAAPKTEEGVIAMMRAAYEDANLIYAPQEDGMEANIDLFGMYCSKEFNSVIEQVREIEAKKDNENDCFFADWNALWHFWDDGVVTPKDFDVSIDGDTADVTFELTHGKDSATQAVALVYEDGQWRVNDWLQRGMDGLSMVEQMKEYIKNNQ